MNLNIEIPFPQDPMKPLTEKQRNVFQSLITETLKNRADIYRADTAHQRAKMEEEYRRQVGWPKMKERLEKLDDKKRAIDREIDGVLEKMAEVGLDKYGSLDRYSERHVKDPRHREALLQVSAAIDAAIKEPGQMEKNMILAQLWTVHTVGEAVDIINRVMQNKSPLKQLAA